MFHVCSHVSLSLDLIWTSFFHLIFFFFHLSFCNLTVEFGVQVYGTESPMEEIPTFLVLGSSCLATIILLFSVYYTSVLCSN